MKKTIFTNITRSLFFLLLCAFSTSAFAQQVTVSGKVTDSMGPLPGVTILEKGTMNGTITNMDGEYTLEVPGDATLVFSFVGMKTQEIPVNGRSNIDVALASATIDLDQVVVTGYQTQRKADLTGAVSVVDMKDVSSVPSGNIMTTLQGRLPGLSITTDGTPGGVNTVAAIRGITTINNNAPLYVIDGVQTRSNIATLLNSSDVESVQVLKDAASASIYGAKAANGVIIITTKSAEKGKVKVDFNSQLSLQTFNSGLDMLNTQQWGEVYWKAYQNDGIKPQHDLYGSGDSPVIPDFIDEAQTIPSANTNWADEVYETALLQSYNLTVSKGSENGSSTFSFNYFDQDGLIKYTNFTRYNARVNSNYNYLNNRLRIGENINISNWDQILKPGGIEELTIAQHPIIPVYDINGGYAGPTQGIGDKPNPIRLLDQQKQNRDNQWRIFGNIFAEVEPLENLVLRSDFGLNYRSGFLSNFEPRWSEGDRTVDKNSLTTESNYTREWLWSNTLNYNFSLNNHSFTALAGMEAKEEIGEWLSGRREDFLIEAPDYRYLDAGGGSQTNGGNATRTSMSSYFGKLDYSFNSRYLLSGTVRRDASSRFGKNDNSAVFPAVSAGWRISEESFLANVSLIDDLKLRASWGKNGNDLLDNEATFTKYVTNLNKAGYDVAGINTGVIYNGIIKQWTGNPNIKWEVTTQTNFGIDLVMLNNRLLVTLDYYLKDTEDMLINRPYIAIIGEGGDMAYNGASMKNNGFEGVVTWRDNLTQDIAYDIKLSASAYKNEITDLPEDIYYTWGGGNGVDKSIVGQPLGSWMGYKTNGLYRTEDELNNGINQPGKGLGRIRYVDINGDDAIDSDDRTWLGSDQPKFIGGLNVAMTYKAFDLTFFLTGMVRDAYNNSKFYTDFFQLWTGNHGAKLLDAWNTEDNFSSSIPALTAVNLNDEGRTSEYFIEDGSYIKMKNFTLGYTLPNKLMESLKMRNARVYFQAQDLFTLTSYSGADPEELGYPYPIPRTFTLGLNIGF